MQELAGEAPQFHQLAPDAQPSRAPEREGEEHRRGRRDRGGRGRGERGERGDRPREHQQVGDPAVIEQQRRIHELESRAEQEQQEPAAEPRQQEVVRTEPPAFLRREEESQPEPVRARPEPVAEAPRIDPKKLLETPAW